MRQMQHEGRSCCGGGDGMTRDEAQKEVDRLKALPVLDFCPLLKDVCRKDCTCYVEAYKRQHSDASYFTQIGYCGNAMFSNECRGMC